MSSFAIFPFNYVKNLIIQKHWKKKIQKLQFDDSCQICLMHEYIDSYSVLIVLSKCSQWFLVKKQIPVVF